MYCAVFELGPAFWHQVVLRTPFASPEEVWVAVQKSGGLFARADVDVSFRVQYSEKETSLLVWVGASQGAVAESAASGWLDCTGKLGWPTQAAHNQREHDTWVGPTSSRHWYLERAREHRGHTWIVNFRVWEALPLLQRAAIEGGWQFFYQINTRQRRSDPPQSREAERARRKALLRLSLDREVPPGALAYQQQAVESGARSSLLVEEYLGARDPEGGRQIPLVIHESFAPRHQQAGFPEAPFVEDDGNELLASGLHRSFFAPLSPMESTAMATTAGDLLQGLAACLPPPTEPATTAGSASAGARPDVFVSYAFRDLTAALTVCGRLEAEGMACWLAPRDVPAGCPYPEAIVQAIRAARVMVVIVSATSNRSNHVHREVERALSHDLVIIPLRVEDVAVTGSLEYLISLCHRLDAIGAGFEPGLTALVRSVKSSLTR